MAGRSPLTKAEQLFDELIKKHGRLLRDLIVRLCPKDLGLDFNDIEQEARMRLWRAVEAEREILNPASYIYKIAATTTIDAIRHNKARREEQLRLADEGDKGGRLLADEGVESLSHAFFYAGLNRLSQACGT
jgi:RNA polymerase sigma-70 factor, ECF subfamily